MYYKLPTHYGICPQLGSKQLRRKWRGNTFPQRSLEHPGQRAPLLVFKWSQPSVCTLLRSYIHGIPSHQVRDTNSKSFPDTSISVHRSLHDHTGPKTSRSCKVPLRTIRNPHAGEETQDLPLPVPTSKSWNNKANHHFSWDNFPSQLQRVCVGFGGGEGGEAGGLHL